MSVGGRIGVPGYLTACVDGEPTAAGATEGAEVRQGARRIEESMRPAGCDRYAPGNLPARVNPVRAGARPEVDQRILAGSRMCGQRPAKTVRASTSVRDA